MGGRVAGPVSDMARSSYVATAGSETVTPIIDWCRAQQKTAAANFMDENLHFEVTHFTYDPETGMESEEVVGDSLITGTAFEKAAAPSAKAAALSAKAATPSEKVATLSEKAAAHSQFFIIPTPLFITPSPPLFVFT